jgi:hypothetical protein
MIIIECSARMWKLGAARDLQKIVEDTSRSNLYLCVRCVQKTEDIQLIC